MGGRPTCVCSVGRQRAFDSGSTAAIDRHCLNCQNARAARLSLTSYSTLWRKVGPLAFLRTDYGGLNSGFRRVDRRGAAIRYWIIENSMIRIVTGFVLL